MEVSFLGIFYYSGYFITKSLLYFGDDQHTDYSYNIYLQVHYLQVQCKIQIHTCSKYGHSYLTFTQSPLTEWIPCQAAMVTGMSYALNLIKFDPKIPLAKWAISDIRLGFKLKPQKNRHFPVNILTAIINVLCVACRILPGSNAPFCLRLSGSGVVQHSSSRELPRATASLGLNTCDPEAVQLDLAMNLDQSQSPFPGAAVANANY